MPLSPQVADNVTDAPPNKRWRWFTFRLSTLFAAITIIALVCGWPRIWREIQFSRFKSYVGKDLRQLPQDEQTEFASLVTSLMSEHQNSQDRTIRIPVHWFVCRINTNRGVRYGLFDGDLFHTVPGDGHGQLHLFDSSGRYLKCESFKTGNRTYPRDAELVTDQLPNQPLLLVRTQTTSGHEPQFCYAIWNDRLALIRLQDYDGQFQAYVDNSHWQSPLLDGDCDDLDRLIQQLPEQNEASILRALGWLRSQYETAKHAEARRHPQTRIQVEKLTRHPHRWVAEAAKATLAILPQDALR